MRRLLPGIAAVLVAAALPAAASAQGSLPSYTEPNGPGSISVPFNLSAPPARPAQRSYEQLVALWQSAGRGYGVPWQVLAAINKIESNFGQNMGPSSAGALGWMQFIPSSWMRWGMDADGDGVADPWDPEDAVFSAARYLAAAGAHEDLERAIFAYNHAQWYVDDVLELAATFGDDPLSAGAPALAFPFAALEGRLTDARRRVARTSRAIDRAGRRLEQLEWQRLQAEQAAGNPSLSTVGFRKAETRLARIVRAEDALRRRSDRLRLRLEDSKTALASLQSERAGAALAGFAPLDGSAPAAIDGYVFPVGGGPSAVSVAHEHHDYPAADIAAPEGSPLYALADSTVVDAWPEENGRCGIGLSLRLETGVSYVYCHLSYLEPHVVPGTALAAGAPVGLVGSTGNSTGPHLHLAYDPSVAYPQEEAWFQTFAGRAFSWQDAPTPERPAIRSGAPFGKPRSDAGPVYKVVRTRVLRFTSSAN
ncbi:MAG: lytic murein transglycosylase [Gaiellaceae bacterium]